MAIGDIPGDNKMTGLDLTPEQRLARQAALSQGGAPSSLSSIPIPAPAGPIGRAQQQLPSGGGLSDVNLGVGGQATRQTSFDTTNTPAKYLSPGAQPGTGTQPPAAPQQAPASTGLYAANLGIPEQGAAFQPPASTGLHAVDLGMPGQGDARQTSFDVTNTAPKYLPPAAQSVGAAPAQAPTQPASSDPATPSSLSHANMVMSPQAGQPAAGPGVFSTDPLVKNSQIAAWRNQSSLTQIGPQAVGVVNGAKPIPTAPVPISLTGVNLLTAGQQPPAPPAATAASGSTDVTPPPTGPLSPDQYRSTGIGVGAKGGLIAARLGADGGAEFSNESTAQQSTQGLGQISAVPNSRPASTQPSSLADLGSAANLGDGIGTFSQAQPGDAALSMARFNRAHDLRESYKNQDRLDQALGAQWSADHTNVIHDSSKPLSLSDIRLDQSQQQSQAQAGGRVVAAQGLVDSGLKDRASEQQLKQAASLNDLQVRATAPDATDADYLNYARAKDPAGLLKLQQSGGIAQLKAQGQQIQNNLNQQKIDIGRTSQQQALQDRAKATDGQIASVDMALSSVNKLLGTKVDPKNPDGPRLDEDKGLTSAVGLSSAIPSLPGSAASDFEARNATLKAQTFLPQVSLLKGMGALSNAEGEKLTDSIASLSTKQSPNAYRANLKIIADAFGKTRARLASGTLIAPNSNQEFSDPVTFGKQEKTAPIPTVTSKAQADALPAGSVFIGPDGKQYRK